jgi:hypothetical protein
MRDWMKIRMEFSKQFQQQESEVNNPYVFNPKTTKVVWRKPTPLPRINYQAEDAIAQWHKEKTKSSMAEAFRTADYATGLWRCETDWDRTKEYLGWILMWIGTLGALYLLATWFNGVMP